MKKREFKTAFILGAGLGVRLRPLTNRCPKPLLEIAGRAAITYAMDHLLTWGVDRFIVNTHRYPEAYEEKFPNSCWRGIPITFRHEPVLLDTGGGLKNIEDLISQDETILCYNGDIIADFPMRNLLNLHEQKRPEATLALRSRGPLMNVDMNSRGEICDIRHVLKRSGIRSYCFTGIYAVETSLLQHIEAGKAESIVSVLTKRIAKHPGSVMGVLVDEGNWYDIGSVKAYEYLKTATGILRSL